MLLLLIRFSPIWNKCSRYANSIAAYQCKVNRTKRRCATKCTPSQKFFLPVFVKHGGKPVHGFFGRFYPHLSGRGEHPPVERVAEIYRNSSRKVRFVNDLCMDLISKAVDDAVHERVLAEQLDLALLAVQHGKLLREEIRYVEILWFMYNLCICDLKIGNAVNSELGNNTSQIMKADNIVGVIIPEHRIRRNGITLSVVAVLLLFLRRIVVVLKRDSFFPDNGFEYAINYPVYILVDRFEAGIYVQMALQHLPVIRGDERGKPSYQLMALFLRDKSRGLHRVDKQFELRHLKMAARHMVLVLYLAVYYDVDTERDKLIDVLLDGSPLAGHSQIFKMSDDVRKRDRVSFVRGLPKIFENDEDTAFEHCVVCHLVIY